jgi:hypothetical protein
MICRRCGEPLTKENYGKYAVQRRTHWRICNNCFLEWYRNWERTSPAAARREHHKNYARANYIGYSPLTGELTLDFGENEDNTMLAKINDWARKANAKRVLRFEFMEIVKEWTM